EKRRQTLERLKTSPQGTEWARRHREQRALPIGGAQAAKDARFSDEGEYEKRIVERAEQPAKITRLRGRNRCERFLHGRGHSERERVRREEARVVSAARLQPRKQGATHPHQGDALGRGQHRGRESGKGGFRSGATRRCPDPHALASLRGSLVRHPDEAPPLSSPAAPTRPTDDAAGLRAGNASVAHG